MAVSTLSVDADGDLNFGIARELQAVIQMARQRIFFIRGEWFLDTSKGVDYSILGRYGIEELLTQRVVDAILEDTDITDVTDVETEFMPNRSFEIKANVSTVYGTAALSTNLEF